MTALDFIFYVFQKFYNMLFTVEIESGVTIGWVIITIMLFVMIISSLFNIPSGLHYGSYGEMKNGKVSAKRGFFTKNVRVKK